MVSSHIILRVRELNKINYFTETKTFFFVQGVREKKLIKRNMITHERERERI